MKATVIKEMSSSEIQERIDNEKAMLQKLKMNHTVSPLENPLKIKFTKRTIARLLTELRTRDNGTDTKEDTKGSNAETKDEKKQ
jgi:large subunit ribosomal protein L29